MPRIAGSGSGGAVTGLPASVVINYAEITSIVSGLETTIVTYTAPMSSKKAYLQLSSLSGDVVASYRIYVNSSVVDKKYSYYTNFNSDFDYRTCNDSTPGIFVTAGTTVMITVIHNRPYLGNFNGNIQILEVG